MNKVSVIAPSICFCQNCQPQILKGELEVILHGRQLYATGKSLWNLFSLLSDEFLWAFLGNVQHVKVLKKTGIQFHSRLFQKQFYFLLS